MFYIHGWSNLMSVCVHLSLSGIVSKRLNVSSKYFHRLTAPLFLTSGN